MPQIDIIDDKLIGQKLDQAILNKFGQILLPAGLEIAEKHISLLNTWGVKSVQITSDGSAESSKESDEDVQLQVKAKELLRTRLLWKPRNAMENELYALALKTAMKFLARKQSK
jgi:hypothetical protein